jgi:hypothetical protein
VERDNTICTSILLAVERDTPCTSILLAVEMDTPGKSNAGEVEKGYTLHVNADSIGERDTLCTFILLMLVV